MRNFPQQPALMSSRNARGLLNDGAKTWDLATFVNAKLFVYAMLNLGVSQDDADIVRFIRKIRQFQKLAKSKNLQNQGSLQHGLHAGNGVAS